MMEKIRDGERIAAEWDYDKNDILGYTPETIGVNTKIRFWWHCTNGKSHSFQATIAKRVSGAKCAVCHGKQHSIDTSIAFLFPEICKEWSDKNGKPPTEYSKGSEEKVWWKCAKAEHPDYAMSIYSRVHLKSGCPICSRKRRK